VGVSGAAFGGASTIVASGRAVVVAGAVPGEACAASSREREEAGAEARGIPLAVAVGVGTGSATEERMPESSVGIAATKAGGGGALGATAIGSSGGRGIRSSGMASGSVVGAWSAGDGRAVGARRGAEGATDGALRGGGTEIGAATAGASLIRFVIGAPEGRLAGGSHSLTTVIAPKALSMSDGMATAVSAFSKPLAASRLVAVATVDGAAKGAGPLAAGATPTIVRRMASAAVSGRGIRGGPSLFGPCPCDPNAVVVQTSPAAKTRRRSHR
jgi:hypothetical protein